MNDYGHYDIEIGGKAYKGPPTSVEESVTPTGLINKTLMIFFIIGIVLLFVKTRDFTFDVKTLAHDLTNFSNSIIPVNEWFNMNVTTTAIEGFGQTINTITNPNITDLITFMIYLGNIISAFLQPFTWIITLIIDIGKPIYAFMNNIVCCFILIFSY